MATVESDSLLEPSDRFSREAAAGYGRCVIENAEVVLAGCGALGQFTALVLALIGYPKVIFVDMDEFEESNIGRSPFYRKGMKKARATAMGARRLCTATCRISYRFFEGRVQELGDALFASANKVIVLAAVDHQPARMWLVQRCRVTGVPLVEGGFHGERWNLSLFRNQKADEPCWACDQTDIEQDRLFSCLTYASRAQTLGMIPATAPGAMTLAAHQVAAATAILHGRDQQCGTTVFGNLENGSSQVMKRAVNPACRLDHEVRATKAIALKASPEASVEALLDEVAELVADPIIELPASFIRVAPCLQCHKPVAVERPEWGLSGAPICTACGGSFSPCNRVPEQHGTLARETSQDILNLSNHQIGLGPNLHLNVRGRARQVTVRLAGEVSLLLKEAALDSGGLW